MSVTVLRSAACGVLFLSFLAPAHAGPDAKAIADSLAASVAATGDAALTYDSATAAGDTVMLTNVKLAAVSATAGDSVIAIPSLVITGAAPRQPGGFTATGVTFDGGSIASHGDKATWTTGALADVVVLSPGEVKAHTAQLRPFGKATIAGLEFTGADFPAAVDVAGIDVAVSSGAADAPSNLLVHATGVRLPTTLLGNSVVNTVVGMLHYDQFLADIGLDAEYDPTGDTATVHALTIDAAGVGKLTIAGKASSFSLRQLLNRQTSAAARASASLDALTVRVDNAGFVERLLDMQAQLLGGTRDDVRAEIVDGALPFALSFIDNDAFRTQVLAAMTTFLKDPHSLTITLAPAAPVPFGKALHTVAHAPGAIPDLLAPTIEANN